MWERQMRAGEGRCLPGLSNQCRPWRMNVSFKRKASVNNGMLLHPRWLPCLKRLQKCSPAYPACSSPSPSSGFWQALHLQAHLMAANKGPVHTSYSGHISKPCTAFALFFFLYVLSSPHVTFIMHAAAHVIETPYLPTHWISGSFIK